ncbi:MAG: glucosamine-6-phosphate deaminase [Dethiobacteria bacterium]
MIVKILENYMELSKIAASMVAGEIKRDDKLVLGLATGSTPEGMYAELIRKFKAGEVDFTDVTTFNLDEYASLAPDHPQSYHFFMNKHLFDHINIKPENINIPDGCSSDLDHECYEYDLRIEEAGGIGLQILGIGTNGHIGFNEPAEMLCVHTHLVDLSAETIKVNSRFFESFDQVPRKAVTMGMGTIMHAEKIVLLASGKSKAAAIRQTVSGGLTTAFPASLLQLHKNVTVLLDREAASLI